MNRKKKRDARRVAPVKSVHALRYVNGATGALVQKTTTFVTPEMRDKLKDKKVKETW